MSTEPGVRVRFALTGARANAITDDLLRVQEFAVTIDEETHQVGGKPEVFFPCTPGTHHVEVVLHTRGAFGISLLERFETAKARPFTGATCDAVVPEDGTVTLVYTHDGAIGFSLTPA